MADGTEVSISSDAEGYVVLIFVGGGSITLSDVAVEEFDSGTSVETVASAAQVGTVGIAPADTDPFLTGGDD